MIEQHEQIIQQMCDYRQMIEIATVDRNEFDAELMRQKLKAADAEFR
jgi:ribosomal protein S3